MKQITVYLNKIENPQHWAILQETLYWVNNEFPHLEPRITWNQPVFTDHSTFIIGFSAAKHHFAVASKRGRY